MNGNFVIGDRLKSEYIATLDSKKQELRFTTKLESAERFNEAEAKTELQKLKETGFHLDLEVYFQEDGRAYILGERDN